MDVRSGITRVADGAVIPVNIGHGFNALRMVIGVGIDLVMRNRILPQVLSHLFNAPRGVNHNFPALGMKNVKGLAHIITRCAENVRAFVPIVLGDHAVEIDRNSSFRIVVLRSHSSTPLVRPDEGAIRLPVLQKSSSCQPLHSLDFSLALGGGRVHGGARPAYP
jgi:hypothetical protein